MVAYEAAVYWGYTLSEWDRESQVNRARAIAHYLSHCVLEAFNSEKMYGDKSGEKSGKAAQLGSIIAEMGL